MGQILGVRWAGLLACFVVSTAWAAPRLSNPAFLGIEMRNPWSLGPCMIGATTPDSPAQAAGLRGDDIVLALDGKPIVNCDLLLDEITAHAPGDTIQLKVMRFHAPVVVHAQLTTRDALLHKLIGKPMVATNLIGVDDDATYDLSALHGQMAIVGLYSPACVDCATLFTKFLGWARVKARKGGPQPLVLAVMAGELTRDLKALQNSLDVPLVAGEFVTSGQDRESLLFSHERVIFDRDRLGVIVIDGRGIVQYIGPIAPNGDDTEAVLDELFAAAEQASHRSK